MGGNPTDKEQMTSTLLGDLTNWYQNSQPQVYDKSMYPGSSDLTKSSWTQGSDFSNQLMRSGGLLGSMGDNINVANLIAGGGGGPAVTFDGRARDGHGGDGIAEARPATSTSPSALADPLRRTNQAGDQFMSLYNEAGGRYGDLYDNAGQPSLTEQTLMGVARGDELGEQSPAYTALRDKAMQDARTAANRQYSVTGRLGSSMGNRDMSEGMTNAALGYDFQNMLNNQNRQMGALGAIEGQRQLGFGNQANALSGMFGTQGNALSGALGAGGQGANIINSDIANRLTASNQAFNQQQTGMNNMFNATGLLANLGKSKDADMLSRRMGDADLFNRTNNADFDQLSKAFGLLGMSPDQVREPGFLDYLGLGADFLGAVL